MLEQILFELLVQVIAHAEMYALLICRMSSCCSATRALEVMMI